MPNNLEKPFFDIKADLLIEGEDSAIVLKASEQIVTVDLKTSKGLRISVLVSALTRYWRFSKIAKRLMRRLGSSQIFYLNGNFITEWKIVEKGTEVGETSDFRFLVVAACNLYKMQAWK